VFILTPGSTIPPRFPISVPPYRIGGRHHSGMRGGITRNPQGCIPALFALNIRIAIKNGAQFNSFT
jgi:hypothetical protein